MVPEREVHAIDRNGLVHLHVAGASNNFKCRMSVPPPRGGFRGVLRTKRPLSCFWCIGGRRFK